MKFITDRGGVYEAGDEAEIARAGALVQEARLNPLIDKLEGYLKKCGTETVDRSLLRMIIVEGVGLYRARRYIAEKPIDALHRLAEFREPLRRMIEILKGKHDISDFFVVLGAPPNLALSLDEQALRTVLRRYEDGLDFLDALYRALPPPPPPLPPHRPATTGDLQKLVDLLADYWERATGARFTQKWHRTDDGKLQAATSGAAFVHEVVCYVAPDALPSLPGAAEAAARRLRGSRK